MPLAYTYELRRGDAIVATGQLIRDQPLEVGDRMTIGRYIGVVREIGPTREGIARVRVQLLRDA